MTAARIRERLMAGESAADIAGDLGLDVRETSAGVAVVLAGFAADDGNCAVTYPEATSAGEAAREYVDTGDWGDDESTTRWVRVSTWRVALVPQYVECAWCDARATAHDAVGDPACVVHAAPPECADLADLTAIEVLVVRLDEDTHRVEIEAVAPPCVGGDDEHDWQRPYEIVGGIPENPGVWGHGAGVIIDECCVQCGCRRETDTWATDPEDGSQGHTSVTYDAMHYDLGDDDDDGECEPDLDHRMGLDAARGGAR